MWIAGGARWFFGNPPPYWNPWMQLIEARLAYAVPTRYEVRTALNATVSEIGPPLDLSQGQWRVRVAA